LISGGTFAGNGDMLATTTTGTSITANYDSTTETLTLRAHYGRVLEAVTFTAGENPTDYAWNRPAQCCDRAPTYHRPPCAIAAAAVRATLHPVNDDCRGVSVSTMQ
jgi:hypothetical protein